MVFIANCLEREIRNQSVISNQSLEERYDPLSLDCMPSCPSYNYCHRIYEEKRHNKGREDV